MMNNTLFSLGDHNSCGGFEFGHHFLSASTTLSTNLGSGFSDDQVGDGESRVVESDYFDGVFKYIQQMLMEEDDMESRPCMFQDCMALQAAEKSFYDALTQKNDFIDDDCNAVTQFVDSNFIDSDLGGPESSLEQQNSLFCYPCDGPLNDVLLNPPLNNKNNNHQAADNGGDAVVPATNQGGNSSSKKSSQGKKNHNRQDGDQYSSEGRNPKQFASTYVAEPDHTEGYDKALLCPAMSPSFYEESSDSENVAWNKQKSCHLKESKRGRPRGSKKGAKTTNEVVDLTCLLTRCAEAAASYNSKTFVEVVKKIRQHSSPFGDGNERLAYCFANALEARFSGGDTNAFSNCKKISASDFLKAYQVYITACPFKRMSNIFANKSIAKLSSEATKVHIIDFGILYGFQWPCLIHGISLRPGGPPKLRITGIDFPQPGFRPAERVEETGRRLENYSKRFNVPFEYKAIAKRWDAITLEDLNIEKDEFVVVNCLYRLKNIPDETVSDKNPRDAVLNLINEINPHFFVHGVVNAMYNAPFFTTRFREALFHFSSQFDMFEATMAREDEGRRMFEQEIFGRDIMNVIACEGTERVERPESYKQWQVRNQIAGFKRLPLNQDIVKEVKAKVKMAYHRDFLVDEDSNWMLQGWKGRIMYALSVWEPIHRS